MLNICVLEVECYGYFTIFTYMMYSRNEYNCQLHLADCQCFFSSFLGIHLIHLHQSDKTLFISSCQNHKHNNHFPQLSVLFFFLSLKKKKLCKECGFM